MLGCTSNSVGFLYQAGCRFGVAEVPVDQGQHDPDVDARVVTAGGLGAVVTFGDFVPQRFVQPVLRLPIVGTVIKHEGLAVPGLQLLGGILRRFSDTQQLLAHLVGFVQL